MANQPAFPSLETAMKKKQTRREIFLADMDVVVPRSRLLALIEPHSSKTGPKVVARRYHWGRCSASIFCRIGMR